MSKRIEAQEYPILKVFSSNFDYHIPSYQRPYAWSTDELATLFEDLLDFYEVSNDDAYFLGSIVLVKEDDNIT
ncbi:DUF262 domain-containing protein [Enterococcus lactis]|uniref:DUF262 domain-containing protein n=1 Tax=Enterococcus lactis TaxID=357441 RepID=UPI0034E96635